MIDLHYMQLMDVSTAINKFSSLRATYDTMIFECHRRKYQPRTNNINDTIKVTKGYVGPTRRKKSW